MRDLINSLFRWLAKNFVYLLFAIAILIGSGFIKQQWEAFDQSTLDQLQSKLYQLRTSQTAVEQFRKDTESELKKLVPSPGTALRQIEGQRKQIKSSLDKARKDQQALSDKYKYTSGLILPTSPDFQKKIELEIQIALLDQASSHTEKLYVDVLWRVNADRALAWYNAEIKQTSASIRLNKYAQWKLSKAHPIKWRIWGTDAYKWMKVLEQDLKRFEQGLKNIEANLAAEKSKIEKKNRGGQTPFLVNGSLIDKVMQPLTAEIKKVTDEKHKAEQQLNSNWFQRAAIPVAKVLPTALWIVFGIIVTPIAIKLFTFYFVAPLATRRPGICLLPGSSGLIQFGTNDEVKRTGSSRASTVSKSITLDDRSELLVHPEFLQSVSLNAKKATKWLLDWSMPLTSLASGMYGLTRVYPDGSEPVVISSSKDPLLEINEIDLPAGSAVVLQPRCLVGIVQRPDEPICIKGYWRFGLSNWLTMQLRYVVFHGPARLIVKGCRGIRIEPVNTGRAINQAAMLGFSANLQYAVTRCETFGSYLMGKQELFNDRFSGQPGCCIYEETPHPNAKMGITGRGIEGVFDSFLKIFGI